MKSFIPIFALALGGAAPTHAAPMKPAAPAVPAPIDPEKLALATTVADALWPDGTYGRMVQDMAGGNGIADLVLDLKPEEIMGSFLAGMPKDSEMANDGNGPVLSPKDGKPSKTLREELTAKDPYFEERMRITMKVVGEEVARIAKPIEPKLRAGIAKSIARRFTREQLVPIAAFFQTEPGKAYAAQSMTLFIDKDVMLAILQSVPAIVKELPGAMDKVKKATAHLPPPPKDDKKADADDGDDQDEDELPST